jgi:hypothetical protein
MTQTHLKTVHRAGIYVVGLAIRMLAARRAYRTK